MRVKLYTCSGHMVAEVKINYLAIKKNTIIHWNGRYFAFNVAEDVYKECMLVHTHE